MVDHGFSAASLNASISGLKFFFEVSIALPELVAELPPVHLLRRLPASRHLDEVKCPIAAADNLKRHQTAPAPAYARALRISEVVS